MKKNIAVVGAGYWGKNLIRNFHKLGVLHTVCDIDEKSIGDASESIGHKVFVTTNYQEVLDSPLIDGVVIATSSSLHHTMTKQALLAGKDVFVEKPFTLNVSDAEELVKLSVDRKRVLLVGHLMLYHPAIQLLKDYIRSGELGEIYYLYSTRVNLGQVRNDEDVLWRLSPHDISIFIYLLGGTPSVISAQGFSYIQSGLTDVVFALLKFGEVAAHIQVSWLDPHKVRRLTVIGSKKMAVFDDTAVNHKLTVYDKSVNKADLSIQSSGTVLPDADTADLLATECEAFVTAMQTRVQPLSGAEMGLEVTKVLEAASKIMRMEENR